MSSCRMPHMLAPCEQLHVGAPLSYRMVVQPQVARRRAYEV